MKKIVSIVVSLLLVVSIITACSNAKAITAFSFASPSASATIDENAKTISINVPYDTDVTTLVATFTTTGKSVRVGSTAQASGITPNDFTNPVSYVVTAADGTTATYTVTVTVARNPAKAITAYSFADPVVNGIIDENSKTISVTVPCGTDLTSLVAIFTTTGASVKIGSTAQKSGKTPNNFTSSVFYTVIAEDDSTTQYNVTVNGCAGWETHQRDSAHRGYVPMWLDPLRFTKAWEWQLVNGRRINPVVTSKGKVYITNDVSFDQGTLYALNESDGTEAWKVSFGRIPALNPPAVSNDIVYTAVTGHEETFLWSFNAQTGSFLHKSPFEGQWPHIMAPTVYGDQVYTLAGYYGGITYSFSTVDGSLTWTYSSGGLWDMFTPAVDNNYVYHYDGISLILINRTTGTLSASINDPFGSRSDDSYYGAPVIGGRNNVFTFAGGAFSGSASSSTEQYEQRVFSSFNINTKSYEWSTSNAYITAPAVANGVIYAARNSPMSLDAIDEATGKVLWSWAPAGNGDTAFHRNIIATKNLLFVSTDKAVYALDLTTKTPVWRYPQPGMLAISADFTLYIATGARESDGRLIAINLK